MPARPVHFCEFHDEATPTPARGSMSANGLSQWLRGAHPFVVPAQEAHLVGEPRAKCIVLLDALAGQFDVALPLLRDRRLTAFIIVPQGHEDGHLDSAAVERAFARRHFAGDDAIRRAFLDRVDRSDFGPLARLLMEEFDLACRGPAGLRRRFEFVARRVLDDEQRETILQDLLADAGVTPEAVRQWFMTPSQLAAAARQGHRLVSARLTDHYDDGSTDSTLVEALAAAA